MEIMQRNVSIPNFHDYKNLRKKIQYKNYKKTKNKMFN